MTTAEKYRELLNEGYTHGQIAESKTPTECLTDFVEILKVCHDIETSKKILTFICCGSLDNADFIKTLVKDETVALLAEMEVATAIQKMKIGLQLTHIFSKQ